MRVLDDHKTLAIAAAAAAGGTLAVWAVSRAKRSTSMADPASTSFEAFLKTHIDNPSLAAPKTRHFAPTSFEAFLKNPDVGPGGVVPAGATTTAPPAPAVPRCPPGARPVTVLFGTEFGFSREIAEKLCAAITAAHDSTFWPELLNMADLPSGLPLVRCQALLVVCSTQGDGVPPTEAREFCAWLHGADGAAAAAAGPAGALKFTVAALGDRSYAHYAACGRGIDARLEDLGAFRFLPRVDVNKEDWKAVDAWIAGAVAALPSLGLATAAELGWAGVAADRADAAGCATSPGPDVKKWTKSRPYYARVVSLEGLCRLSGPGDKNTVRVGIDLGDSEIAYQPGDALGVWPSNDPVVVEDLLEAAGVDGDAPVSLPSWHYAGEGGAAAAGESSTLREVLSVCYDLRSPKPDLLRLLAAKLEALVPATAVGVSADSKKGGPGRHRSTDSNYSDDSAYSNDSAFDVVAQSAAGGSAGTSISGGSSADDLSSLEASARLAALLSSADDTAAYLSARHVADVLRDWRPAALSSSELLGTLRQLAPRLYSISSSPLETSPSGLPPGRTVQITVAVVRYESLGRPRGGVASTCLGERATPGARIPVYLYPNPEFHLPTDPSTPVVMCGPGTGLAPFRGFLRHRALLSSPSASKPGPAVLFFGCRRRDQDFLYGSELEAAAAAGEVELHTAFSREGPAKVYVQHRIKENADRVWALLGAPGARGVLYVCGDGAHMAADVEATVKEIASERLGGDSAAGEEWFKALTAAGRYRKDTWIA